MLLALGVLMEQLLAGLSWLAYIVLLLCNLQATRVQRKGKPIFQLKGAVYYRMAPTMEPSEQNAMGYAQLYVLDP